MTDFCRRRLKKRRNFIASFGLQPLQDGDESRGELYD
jgi:hypothetical protein